MKPMKKALLLHDMCGVGKAALTNMIPVLGTMEIEACPVPTVLLSTHTGGYEMPAILPVKAAYIRECADHYAAQKIHFDIIFVGYIGTEEMADAILYFLSRFPGTLVIMDPIMGDHGNFYSNFGSSYLAAVKKLIPFADILIPNLTEACYLTDTPYNEEYSSARIQDICRALDPNGRTSVIITSVLANDTEKAIAVYEEDMMQILKFPNAGREYHGCGDLFDAVFIGNYLRGLPLEACVKHSHNFVVDCIKESMRYDYDEREGLFIEKILSELV